MGHKRSNKGKNRSNGKHSRAGGRGTDRSLSATATEWHPSAKAGQTDTEVPAPGSQPADLSPAPAPLSVPLSDGRIKEEETAATLTPHAATTDPGTTTSAAGSSEEVLGECMPQAGGGYYGKKGSPPITTSGKSASAASDTKQPAAAAAADAVGEAPPQATLSRPVATSNGDSGSNFTAPNDCGAGKGLGNSGPREKVYSSDGESLKLSHEKVATKVQSVEDAEGRPGQELSLPAVAAAAATSAVAEVAGLEKGVVPAAAMRPTNTHEAEGLGVSRQVGLSWGTLHGFEAQRETIMAEEKEEVASPEVECEAEVENMSALKELGCISGGIVTDDEDGTAISSPHQEVQMTDVDAPQATEWPGEPLLSHQKVATKVQSVEDAEGRPEQEVSPPAVEAAAATSAVAAVASTDPWLEKVVVPAAAMRPTNTHEAEGLGVSRQVGLSWGTLHGFEVQRQIRMAEEEKEEVASPEVECEMEVENMSALKELGCISGGIVTEDEDGTAISSPHQEVQTTDVDAPQATEWPGEPRQEETPKERYLVAAGAAAAVAVATRSCPPDCGNSVNKDGPLSARSLDDSGEAAREEPDPSGEEEAAPPAPAPAVALPTDRTAIAIVATGLVSTPGPAVEDPPPCDENAGALGDGGGGVASSAGIKNTGGATKTPHEAQQKCVSGEEIAERETPATSDGSASDPDRSPRVGRFFSAGGGSTDDGDGRGFFSSPRWRWGVVAVTAVVVVVGISRGRRAR